MMAALRGSTRALRPILDNLVPVEATDSPSITKPLDIQDATGQTALMLAASKGFYDIVKMFLDKGADARVRDKEGLNVFDYAQKEKKILTLLKKQVLPAGTNSAL
jgi:ankyrin repeat protein